MGYRVLASIMPSNQIRTNINAVGCVVRSNHWVVIGCLMNDIVLRVS